jgi:hypothetical protein
METKCNTIEEVVAIWEPMHKEEYPNPASLNDINAGIAYAIAAEMSTDERLLFILSESNYDIYEANNLINRLNQRSKLAEYIHIKFLDNTSGIMGLYSLVIRDDDD